jgi:UDP-2,4-diacetamido-2,4,6-trideoxy-beta-L-altropyranose hydrolase
VIAGGGTLWEALYMMCPIISFARNSVQSQILGSLDRRGVLMFKGAAQSFDRGNLAAAVLELASSPARRRDMSALGREMIDGLGAERVCERMINGDSIDNQLEDGARLVARS